MLQNLPPPLLSAPTDSPAVVKRYAPPNQRNRSGNRRNKASERFDRTNILGNDLEKNQVVSSRNIPVPEHGDAGSSNLTENHYSRCIALEGCSFSAASQLLNDRWTAAVQSYKNPKDSSEKPVMHSGGTSVWTQFRLPHQIMVTTASASSSVSQLDFLGELCRQMHGVNLGELSAYDG